MPGLLRLGAVDFAKICQFEAESIQIWPHDLHSYRALSIVRLFWFQLETACYRFPIKLLVQWAAPTAAFLSVWNPMLAKLYLVVVSLIYMGLAIWSSVQSSVTSGKVGFELKGGAGQSEFMTVYGGLEFGIALVLLATLFRDNTINFGVLAGVLIHVSLVVFRSISFFCYSDIGSFTYRLAAGEWLITLLGVAILFFNSESH